MTSKKIHPLILEAQRHLRAGNISRRDFLRFSSLLGLSISGASILAACAEEEATPTEAAPQPTAVPVGPKRGGTLRVARRLDRVDHPARWSLVSQSHCWRHVFEYLTEIDGEGLVHPYLLESWDASDDLMKWTLKLNQGIKFSDGRDLTMKDVLFSFNQWLDVDIGSSLLGQLSYIDPEGFEMVDDYTLVINMLNPTITLPYDLFHYGACILPEGFGGDITLEPIGTGPFTMEEYTPSERARLVRRDDYWKMGADGDPLPYLDEIVFIHLGDDRSAELSALQTLEVDTVPEPPVDMWEALSEDERFTIKGTPTAATRVLRFRVDQEPWSDNRVRQALKYCHNREKILAVALRNQGVIGNDSHVAPAQPDYSGTVDPYPFDIEKAKELLAEAGYADGVDVQLTVANSWPESVAYAQALKEDAAGAGFNIELNPMPDSQYWEGWTEWNFGITWWAHRPLAPMILALAYTRTADGELVPWNETRWADDEFDSLLKDAQKTLDLEERKAIIGKMEKIQKETGSICTPFFMNVWSIINKDFKGLKPSKEEYTLYHEVYYDPEA